MTDPPNLDLVNLVVSDMEATVAFYRRPGLVMRLVPASATGLLLGRGA